MKPAAILLSAITICLLSAVTVSAQPFLKSLQDHNNRFAEEKVHLHFDKPVYNEGETVWFKAYISSQNFPSAISTSFYAELIDATGKLIERKTYPVYEGTAAGNFDLPESISQAGVVVRAYTPWQLNFDSLALFSKFLPVAKASPVQADPAVKTYNLRFFPEGGDLVSGLRSVLAFTITDQNDYPSNVSGLIKDRNGKVITAFKSLHDGMGKIAFEPEAGKEYYAEWKDVTGVMHTTPLPVAKSNGVIITLSEKPGYIAFLITRSEDAPATHKTLHVVAQMHQQQVYRANIKLELSNITSGIIPTDSLTTGIIQLTVFDSEWKPLAERITFVNKQDHSFDAHINTVSKNLARRGKNIIEIEVPDSLSANLSLAITDAAIDADSEENIATRLFLTGDLRGYVHKPAYYLSSVDDSVKQHLDLVMLTHGWRKYNWDDIAANRMPAIRFQPGNYLSVKGKVLGSGATRLPEGTQLSMILQTKDSSRHFLSAPVSPAGEVSLDGLVFFDTITVFYSFNANKLNRGATVDFRTVPPAFTKTGIDMTWLAKSAATRVPATSHISFAKKRAEILPLLNRKIKVMDEVIVLGASRSRQDAIDKKYTTGVFQGASGRSLNVMDDPAAEGYYDILSYLEGRVAGLSINNSGLNKSATWRSGTPTFYIDEMPTSIDMVTIIPLRDVALIKAFPPPFIGSFGSGSGGGIAIYTKKGGDSYAKRGALGLEKTKAIGYTPLKQFYSPDYMEFSPLHEVDDVRSTLYWEPYILTDKTSRKVRVEFYNNDISGSYRVILEGMNESGRVTRVEKLVTR